MIDIIEPELLDDPPRRARLTAVSQRFRRRYWNSALGVFCLAYLAAVGDIFLFERLARSGVATQARIVGKMATGNMYELRYRFTVGRENYAGSKNVEQADFHQAQVGDPVLVTYLPEWPDLWREGRISETQVSDRRNLWTMGIGLGVFCLLSAGARLENNLRTELRLLREGIVTTAEVIGLRGKTDSNTDCFLYYVVDHPNGYKQAKSAPVSAAWASDHPVGARFSVLCDTIAPDKTVPIS